MKFEEKQLAKAIRKAIARLACLLLVMVGKLIG